LEQSHVRPHIINTLLGIWMMAAPGALRYGGLAADVDWIIGPLIATFACIAVFEATRPLRWVTLVLGAALLIVPWVIDDPPRHTANSVAVGFAVVGLSIIRGPITGRYGGGWSALWRTAAD
jgi:hypothetical protein